MFTVNPVRTSVFCLAGEINLGTVTKIFPVYLGHAHSALLTSLMVVDEAQTLGQLCTMWSQDHQLRAANLLFSPAPLKIRIACI